MILAIDTSSKNLIVALINEKTNLYFDNNCNMQHSIKLLPLIEKVLEENNVKLSDIDLFCSSIGPGSFTGIRIGVSTVKAFGEANEKQIFGYNTFELLLGNNMGKVLTAVDANHNSYYICGFNNGEVILLPKFVREEEFNEIKKEFPMVITDSEVYMNSDKLQENLDYVCNRNKGNVDIPLVPLYVRKSQAEEKSDN